MTTFYDVPADLLNPVLAGKLSEIDAISRPQWADYVKTGIHRERPPTQENWWELRCAALLRKVGREGPIGVNALAQAYGGRKDNGSNPNTPAMGSRHIIRTALQQLSDAGLISMKETKTVQSVDGDQKLYSGRVLTASGQKLLDEVAHSVRPAAEESYPGLAKY
ncbi:MAG: 30S ribosomal protein S19e [Euryarchaeota archaeon]|nr:30S ribosomal protein S19e [Euryarchaeota archaeon]|tara:strand:- start:698 stop:1189 length:492 start_codon:yes stop_codon:yes gene_type:complete